jgi:hypothetical protein
VQAAGPTCKPRCASDPPLNQTVIAKARLGNRRSGKTVLFAALRRDATRHAHHGPSDDPSFRSHAEASRGDRR